MAFSYYRNKHMRRRRKTVGQRRQRMKVHRQRLVQMGWSEEQVDAMDAAQLREALKKAGKGKTE